MRPSTHFELIKQYSVLFLMFKNGIKIDLESNVLSIILFSVRLIIVMTKDWADVTSSEDENSSQNDQREDNHTPQSTQDNEADKQKTKQKWSQPDQIEYSKVKRYEKRDQNKQYKPKDFMTVQTLIHEIQVSKDPIKQLSIVYCFHLNQLQILEKYSMIKTAKKYRQGSFEISFQNKDDVINFLKQKETNRDKFFVKLPQFRESKQKEPTKKKNSYQEKERKDSRQFKKQYKPKEQKQFTEKRENKQKLNIFDQNKWIFDEKKTSKEIIDAIEGSNFFSSFQTFRIIVSEPSSLQNASKLAEDVAKQFKLTISKDIKNGKNELKLSVQAEKISIPKGNSIGNVEQAKESFKKSKGSSRKFYLKDNKIRMFQNMNFQEVLKQINNKQIFNFYGAIRIKSSSELIKSARELATLICKHLDCELIKESKIEDQYILIISQKKQKVKNSLFNQNKIKLTKGINISKAVQEVNKKIPTIFIGFNNIKVEYSEYLLKQGKEFIAEISKLRLIKTSEQTKNIEGVNFTTVTFKQTQTNPKIEANKLQKTSRQQESKKQKPKPKYREMSAKKLFNVQQTNSLVIDKEVSVQDVIQQFQKVRKQFFAIYKCLKIVCNNSNLYGLTREIGQKLREQKLSIRQSSKKIDQKQSLVLEVEEQGKSSTRRKLQVSEVNDYLST